MPENQNVIPVKLKHDFIVEAVFEIRFETSTLPEIFFGRLADYEPWKGFRQDPLPAYAIPALIRQTDPNLSIQPVFQLSSEEGSRLVKVGPKVAAYHRLAPYVGWEKFGFEIDEFVDGVFSKSESPQISRLGIRYINAATVDIHGINTFADLNLQVVVDGDQLRNSLNLNFMTEHPSEIQSVVRIATPNFVVGNVPPGASLVIDVDVFTKPGFKTDDAKVLKNWAVMAHGIEKGQFFRLLTPQTKESLREI